MTLGRAALLACLAWPLAAADGALAEYQQALRLQAAGDFQGAVDRYRAFLEQAPGRPEARTNLGAALAALGRYDEAIAEYRLALEALPNHPGIRRNIALAYYKSGRLTEAVAEVTALRAKEPNEPQLVLLHADSLFRLGREADVIEILEPLRQAQPDQPAVAYLLGTALIREGRVDEGRLLVDEILRHGDSAEPHLMIGLAHVSAGELVSARQEFLQAIKLNPKLALAHSYLGKTLLELGERAGARASFERTLELDSNDYDAQFFLGVMLRQDRQLEAALPHLRSAERLRPGALEVPYQIALVQIGAERLEEARATLEDLLRRAPSFREAHVSLAQVYFRLGRKDDAEKHRRISQELRR